VADGEAQLVGPFLCFCIVLYFLPCFLPSSTAADSSVTRGACGPGGRRCSVRRARPQRTADGGMATRCRAGAPGRALRRGGPTRVR
jgi:hypothetical protein